MKAFGNLCKPGRHALPFVLGLLAALLAAGCGSNAAISGSGTGTAEEKTVAGEVIVGAGPGWTRVEEEPAWVKNPPAREGFFRFVLVRRSNLVELATARNDILAARDAEKEIAARLTGAVKEETRAAIASSASKAMKPVARVVKYTPSPPGKEEIPGSSMAEAWCLWEVPIDAILGDVPEGEREAAAKKLGGAVSLAD